MKSSSASGCESAAFADEEEDEEDEEPVCAAVEPHLMAVGLLRPRMTGAIRACAVSASTSTARLLNCLNTYSHLEMGEMLMSGPECCCCDKEAPEPMLFF